jgi:hypothetical protein
MANLVYCNKNELLKNNCYFALSDTSASNPTQLPSSHTGIANSGASGFYFAPGAPVANLDPKAPTIAVRVANGLPEKSVASGTLASAPSLPPASMRGHVMPSFPHTLIDLGPFANLGYQIVFTKTAVSVIHPDGHSILDGWQEHDGPRLWHFPLMTTTPILPEFAGMRKDTHVEKPVPRGSTAMPRMPPSQSCRNLRRELQALPDACRAHADTLPLANGFPPHRHKPPCQACRCPRCVDNMRKRAHAEALPIFSNRPMPT